MIQDAGTQACPQSLGDDAGTLQWVLFPVTTTKAFCVKRCPIPFATSTFRMPKKATGLFFTIAISNRGSPCAQPLAVRCKKTQ